MTAWFGRFKPTDSRTEPDALKYKHDALASVFFAPRNTILTR